MALRPMAISSVEFSNMMQKVKPPVGWSETLAVANSGGPDSTCLLFLLKRYLQEQRAKDAITQLPRRLVSLTIDHNLQPSSVLMARHAARIAEQLGVAHMTTKLPWGEGIHPQKPGPEDKIEERAREMRYNILLENLLSLNANSLAFGHHLDDQVETMLMRLGRGSGVSGLAAMRSCRRWGMGSEEKGHLPNHQLEKMRKWVIRPLLSVGKDRILATCDVHSLEYVTDKTNFQPQLTIRNAVRHLISEGGSAGLSPEDFHDYPSNIAEQLANINVAASKFDGDHDFFNLASDKSRLHEISCRMTANLTNVDAIVDNLIAKYKIASLSGTFMISPLSLRHIATQDIRDAFLYRVVRYVSPYPWGSPKSELGRRKASVQRLVKHLWNFENLKMQNNSSLCVGSGVLWKLVAITSGRLRTDVRNIDNENLAWIAFRQPPSRSVLQSTPNMLDITNDILQCGITRDVLPQLEIIFDGRFSIQFQLENLPKSILESCSNGGRILVESSKYWALPQVTHVHSGETAVLHTHSDKSISYTKFRIGSNVTSNWIASHYIRPMSAI